jgi:hypothetical protein
MVELPDADASRPAEFHAGKPLQTAPIPASPLGRRIGED